ncbi:MAG: hypothetical protein NC121_02240 [Blautia sp.]|nr:hypothetical protein [Blautia sp.]
MKLRYYLRGLGIGMVVTALLMGVALKGNRPLSDAEIRVRAMELGMVDGDSRRLTDTWDPQGSDPVSPDASEPAGVPDDTPEPTPVPTEPADTPEPTAEPESTSTPEPTAEPEPTNTPEPTVDPLKPLPMVTLKPQQESVTFVVQPRQDSYTVSKALEEAGLVEDASGFDQYLDANGYSRRISTGTYEIPVDATEEEIAKIITRSR